MAQQRTSAVRRGRRAVKAGAFALALAVPTLFVAAATSAAPGVNCNGVFPGATPTDPVTKTASPSSVVPGGTVTYTINWTPKGNAAISLVDCFRVDDGSDVTLNALVEGLDIGYDSVDNDGTEQFVVTIPNDPALIGHEVFNRAKCTSGCQESKSAFVGVSIVEPASDPDPDPDPTDDPTPDPTDDPTDDPTADPTDDPTPDPTQEPVVDDEQVEDDEEEEPQVLAGTTTRPKTKKPKVMASTGVETTAAMYGILFLALGFTARSVRFRPVRQVFAGQGTVAETIALIGIDQTLRRGAIRRMRRR